MNISKNVANKNDKKSKDCATNEGKLLTGNKMPIKMLFEKFGAGNKSKPNINPNNIETNAFFSLNLFL